MGSDNAALPRLRSALGHLEAVLRMVEGNEPTVDLLHQLSAVQGALQAVRRQLLEALLMDRLQPVVPPRQARNLTNDILAATFGGSPDSRA